MYGEGSLGKALRSGNRYGKTGIRAEGILLSCISM